MAMKQMPTKTSLRVTESQCKSKAALWNITQYMYETLIALADLQSMMPVTGCV